MLNRWRRMPMEMEAPEEVGYDRIRANLAESSCSDQRLADLGISLDDVLLQYGDHRGNPELRQALGADAGLGPGAVLLTTGAAMALFLVAITLLGPDEHVVVVRPNYATNLETPWALRCDTSHIDVTMETGFRLDVTAVRRALRPTTRLISITTPHNPTGTEVDDATMAALIHLAEEHGCHLLVDETYGDMASVLRPPAAARSPRVISVSSISKTYGLPGIRVGWLTCADGALMTRLLAVKEQVVLTGSILDEAIAALVWRQRAERLPVIRARIAASKRTVVEWMAGEPRLEWTPPAGGVVAFPRVRADAGVSLDHFYAELDRTGIAVGPGRWFDQPAAHFRIGWGWPTEVALRFGLGGISAALDRAG